MPVAGDSNTRPRGRNACSSPAELRDVCVAAVGFRSPPTASTVRLPRQLHTALKPSSTMPGVPGRLERPTRCAINAISLCHVGVRHLLVDHQR